MERAEKQGLAVAAVGHVALFVLLSLGLFSARIPKPPLADTMDVTIADIAGLQSAAPKVSTEAPKASEAPEQGTPEDSAPPPPAPEPALPPPPEPKPPTPELKPSPPKPVLPTPEKTEPKPEKKAEPKPKPEKPKPEKPKPEKPTKETPKPKKPAPEKPAQPTPDKTTSDKSSSSKSTKPSTSKKASGLPSDFLKDLPKDTGSGKTTGTAKPKGSRLGKDFLKGIGSDAAGRADAPRASAVSARSMAGIGSLIREQVKPNYNPPTGGADAASIVSTLEITMGRDGTVQNVAVVGHKGVNDTNSAYVRQADDAAVRAVRRSSPLHLPPDLYEGGWQNIQLNFSGAQLQ